MINKKIIDSYFFIISCSLFLQLAASEKTLTSAEKKPSLEFLFSSTLQKEDKKKAKQLLQEGADPNIRRYNTPLLHSIIKTSGDHTVALKMSQLLCQSNADVNEKDMNSKETPLTLAIKQEDEKLVELLLQQGANPNIEDGNRDHPIHLAMEWDTEPENRFYKRRKILPKIVKLLLQYKANPNTRYNFKNGTPLHAAVFHNAPEIVKELLSYGAQKEVYDDRGFTPVSLAKNYGFENIVAILSHNTPPALKYIINKEIGSFHVVEIKKTPFNINKLQPFEDKNIIDDYQPNNNHKKTS